MSEAPERIWARRHPVKHGHHWHDATSSNDVAETVNRAPGTINPFIRYVRADIYTAAIARAERAEADARRWQADATLMLGFAELAYDRGVAVGSGGGAGSH
jgi:hypothetical protein